MAHGADTVQYFQWRKSRGASEKFHGAVVDHEGSENTRVFREVAALGKDLAKLDEIIGTDTPTEVGIVYDWENEWAIADFQGFKRERKYEETVRNFYRAFFSQARNIDFVTREGDFSRYKLLVAPHALYDKRKDGGASREICPRGRYAYLHLYDGLCERERSGTSRRFSGRLFTESLWYLGRGNGCFIRQ